MKKTKKDYLDVFKNIERLQNKSILETYRCLLTGKNKVRVKKISDQCVKKNEKWKILLHLHIIRLLDGF